MTNLISRFCERSKQVLMNKKFLFPIIIIVIIGLALIFHYLVNSSLFSTQPQELDPQIQEIKSRGTIIIGTNATFPPMESIDENGNFAGIDIEIAKKIAQDLGVEAEFKQIDWQIIFDQLLAGETDMLISGITILPERTEKMAFSNPYFNAGQVIVIQKNKLQEIMGVANLYGKKIGVQADTTSDFEAQKFTTEVVGYLDYAAAKTDLLNGNLDAIMVDYPVGIDLVAGEENLVILGEPFTQEFYGVAVRKESQALLNQINHTLVQLKKSGELDGIINQWIKK